MTKSELLRIAPNASKDCLAANTITNSEAYRDGTISLETPTPQINAKRKGQANRHGMNYTEKQFYLKLVAGYPNATIKYEPIKLRIGERCWYTPDFMVVSSLGSDNYFRFFEVKGEHIWDDSKVKFKAAQEQYPWFEFQMWQYKKATGWKLIA